MNLEKPFEIKEEFRVGVIVCTLDALGQDLHSTLAVMWQEEGMPQVADYIKAANAEILLLQEEKRQLLADNEQLKQQLADAPTWGEWQNATMQNLADAASGTYQVEMQDGETLITSGALEAIFRIKRFRRLEYVPQPARESDDESNNKSTDQEQEGWTPISNVQPLYDLPNGMYIFKGKNGLPIFAIKDTIDGISSISLQASTRTPSMSWKPLLGDIVELFVSYKLIHAFEEQEKVIPTGAIENTLENRRKQRYGYYVFCADVADQEDAGDQEKPINQILLRDEVSDRWNHFEGWYNSDCIHMDCFEYFKPIDKDKFEAALETLAAQERVRELEANDD